MEEYRFVVEYETNGEGTMRHVLFAGRQQARAYACRVTKDGRAWPAEAVVTGEQRDSQWDEWKPSRKLGKTIYIDGERQ